MQPIARVVGVAVAVAVMGCQTSNASGAAGSGGVSDAERAAITDTSTAIINGMLAGASHLKGSEFAMRFAKDSVAITENGVESPTPAATAASADSLYSTLSSLDSKATAINVKVLSPDAAFAHASFGFTVTAKNGKSTKGSGVATALIQRRGGQWMVTDYHESEADIASIMAALTPPSASKK